MRLFSLLVSGCLTVGALASPPVVCIDPGHPSEVGRGTQGRQITEIHAAWLIAKLLESKLQKQGFTVVLTKSRENQLVRNQQRAEIANKSHADLLIRLHCDAGEGTGFAVYYPDRQGTAEGRTGPSASVLKRTKPIAERFHAAFAKSLGTLLKDNGLMPDTKTAVGQKHGALVGSIFSQVPVVLVEMCVLTNPHDEAFILNPKNQAVVAESLANAVVAALPEHRAPNFAKQ